MAEVSVFSFFAGCGMLDLAFEATNYEIVFVNEFSREFMKGYQYARKGLQLKAPLYGYRNDSAERYLKRCGKRELLQMIERERLKGRKIGFIGGPPCPDFSIGGKNAGATGENGRLTRVYFDLICRCKPDFFVFENVKGLIRTEKHKKFYHEMKCKVHGNRYVIAEKLLNAIEYGVPQFRERIIMIGISDELVKNNDRIMEGENRYFKFDWKKNQRYNDDEINAIKWPDTNEFAEDSKLEAPLNIPLDLTVQYWFEQNHVNTHPNGQDIFGVRKGYKKMISISEGDTRGKSFKRLHRWRYSPTAAYGHNEVHLHPYKARRISVAEAMAIQSLPKEFALPTETSLSSKFKMIGNGVPYLMAHAVAATLMDLMERIENGGGICFEDSH